MRPSKSKPSSKSRIKRVPVQNVQIELLQGIETLEEEVWTALCPSANPFVSFKFLALLERSQSAIAETGWQPVHLLLRDDSGPVGLAPLYLKSHSYGEYVFDWGWADAYSRAGGRYYPKLQCAVPFSPVPGPRLLTGSSSDHKNALALSLRQVCEQLQSSSVHVTFCSAEDIPSLEDAGFMIRHGLQFHWRNRGYGDFADFLDGLRSAKRKMIAKERRRIEEAGIRFEITTGEALTAEIMRGFYPFYRATTDKRWGEAYLTAQFFTELGTHMADQIVLVRAVKDGDTVAAALNLRDDQALYGRVWGCLESYKFLHFETCYYQAIDFAIQNRIAKVEAGAQGMQSKVPRGYEPTTTLSAHYIRDPGLREPVRRFLSQERRQMAAEKEMAAELLPFRQN